MRRKKISFERELSSYKSRALGTFYHDKKILLFHQSGKTKSFEIDRSVDGFDFGTYIDSAKILDEKGKEVDIEKCTDFRITSAADGLFLTYKFSGGQPALYAATSKDLISWKTLGKVSTPAEVGMLVPKIKYNGENLLFAGEKSLLLVSSKNLKTWKILGGPYHNLIRNKKQTLIVADIVTTNEGILVIYLIAGKSLKKSYMIKAALFDKNQPTKIVWDKLIWKQSKKWKADSVPIGAELAGNTLFTYWQSKRGLIFVLSFPYFKSILKDIQPVFVSPIVNKFKNNPILKPIVHHFWESKAVFNPTAFYDEGDIHIIYRAVGDDDVSTLGYAKSKDGFSIHDRHKHPIYVPTKKFEGAYKNYDLHKGLIQKVKRKKSKYVSGPGWGGIEDPRITKIDDRLYMTYVAFNGYDPPRVAISSISVNDFHNNDWNWSEPALMSPPDQAHKNWVLFPEKINNKFAVLHSVAPTIAIDYLDSLDFDNNNYICCHFNPGFRKNVWDSHMRGVGPPPLKTKNGWLIFYHAMDADDYGRYKIGAMLLDIENPGKVLYRSNAPILEPDQNYENDGFKAGVVYACGSIIKDDTLFLYYGASDTTGAVATANIHKFLYELKESPQATLTSNNTLFADKTLH